MVTNTISAYLQRFADERVICNQYALSKLGIDTTHCILKIDEYMLLCAPYVLGLKQAEFIASLSKQELVFFQRYRNGVVGLSLEFIEPRKAGPLKIFVRASLRSLVAMTNRDNVGIFTIDFRAAPENLVEILGDYLDGQQQLRSLYELYADNIIRVTPEIAQKMGYNQYAMIQDSSGNKRFQLFTLSSREIQILEGAAAPARPAGTEVVIQLYFRKYRVRANGKILAVERLSNGIVKTRCQIAFNPEFTEILDDYWVSVNGEVKP